MTRDQPPGFESLYTPHPAGEPTGWLHCSSSASSLRLRAANPATVPRKANPVRRSRRYLRARLPRRNAKAWSKAGGAQARAPWRHGTRASRGECPRANHPPGGGDSVERWRPPARGLRRETVRRRSDGGRRESRISRRTDHRCLTTLRAVRLRRTASEEAERPAIESHDDARDEPAAIESQLPVDPGRSLGRPRCRLSNGPGRSLGRPKSRPLASEEARRSLRPRCDVPDEPHAAFSTPTTTSEPVGVRGRGVPEGAP